MKLSAALSILVFGLASVAPAQYSFFVANSPSGSNPGPYTNGLLRFDVSSGGAVTAGIGIAASAQVVDPAGLFLDGAGRLYIGNRVGNGINPNAGFVSRFDPSGGGFVYSGTTIATNQTGTHGVAVTSSGEVFAANVNGPVTRHIGNTPNGSLNSGAARDVLLSPNGLYAYVTGASNTLQKFSVATGNLLNTFTLSGASQLHWGSWRGSELYISDFGASQVFAVTFDGNGDVSGSSSVAAVNAAISVAFSPDGNEMLVPGHTTGVISRFARTGTTWVPTGVIGTTVNMGDIQLITQPVPEPASLAVLGIGAAALLRRRRRS